LSIRDGNQISRNVSGNILCFGLDYWQRSQRSAAEFIKEGVNIGQLSLAAKRPKERWIAVAESAVVPQRWSVFDDANGDAYVAFTGTESQARAVAAALNADSAK